MSDQEINTAIAEASGWKSPFQNECLREYDKEGGDVWAFCGTDKEGDRAPLSDYCRDLNAMHEALMMQTAELRIRFRKELKHIIAPETKPSKIKVSGICLMGEAEYDLWFHATARQRAEAFLRTLGKWKETK